MLKYYFIVITAALAAVAVLVMLIVALVKDKKHGELKEKRLFGKFFYIAFEYNGFFEILFIALVFVLIFLPKIIK